MSLKETEKRAQRFHTAREEELDASHVHSKGRIFSGSRICQARFRELV
jgi:hypothetical protein